MTRTMTVGEAQRLTDYSRQQIYNLLRDNSVKSEKQGWQHFINRRSLENYCGKRGKVLASQ
jgi:hypothetical protein